MSDTSYGCFPDRIYLKRRVPIEIPDEVKHLIPSEGKQIGAFYYGITPQEIERVKKAVSEAFKCGYDTGYSDRSRETFG